MFVSVITVLFLFCIAPSTSQLRQVRRTSTDREKWRKLGEKNDHSLLVNRALSLVSGLEIGKKVTLCRKEYLITEALSHDGYVFKAEGTSRSKRQVAIKVTGWRFKSSREAEITDLLQGHPNMVKMHCKAEQDGLNYLVLEYIEDGDLGRKFSEDELRSILPQLEEAIQYLRSKNVAHNDLWEKNVMFDRATQRLKIIDFSRAKVLKDEEFENSIDASNDVRRVGELLCSLVTRNTNKFWCNNFSSQRLIVGAKLREGEEIGKVPQPLDLIFGTELRSLVANLTRYDVKGRLSFQGFS